MAPQDHALKTKKALNLTPSSSPTHEGWSHPSSRVGLFDAVRGFSVASMVLFHLCYDLVVLTSVSLLWFKPPFEDIWRSSISWTFLLVSGWMCSFSKNNLTRSLRYLAVAAAIFTVTSLAAVDDPINFGIIFCIGGATLVDALLERLDLEPSGPLAAILLFALFLACLHVPQGSLGLLGFTVELPASLYATPWFSWAGFPGPGFISGDYYPLIPYALIYGAGIALGRTFLRTGYPVWFLRARCRPLQWIGRHALAIYVAHQPIILGCLMLAGLL